MPVRVFLLLSLVLLVGCSSVNRFPAVHTDNAEKALAELVKLSRSIDFFEADATFEIELNEDGEKRQLTIDGEVLFDELQGWHIQILGPFGIKLAIIESDDGMYRIRTPQTGQVREGLLTERITFSSLNLEFPHLTSLSPLLMPIFDFNDNAEWRLTDSRYSSPGYLELRHSSEIFNVRLKLILEYFPLKVIEEHHYRDNEIFMTRTFSYSDESENMPDSINLEFEGLTVGISYKSIRYERKTS